MVDFHSILQQQGVAAHDKSHILERGGEFHTLMSLKKHLP